MVDSGTVTWWGCAAVELAIGGRRLAFDPYLYPDEPRLDYICITHNDYDHCHEETLSKLVTGPFERLMAPPGCFVRSKLDSPVHGQATDLSFVDPSRRVVMYPKYTVEPDIEYPGAVELQLDGYKIETIDSSERPRQYMPYPGAVHPRGDGPFAGHATYPNVGYIVTEETTNLTFYHPGDLSATFDAHRMLRDRIDVMFFPLPKLQGIEVTIVDAIRPKCIIPIHHRVDAPDFPIPLNISQDDLVVSDLASGIPLRGADADVWRRELHALAEAHWYPTTDPPLERFEREVVPRLEELGSRVVVLEAGRPYAVADLVDVG